MMATFCSKVSNYEHRRSLECRQNVHIKGECAPRFMVLAFFFGFSDVATMRLAAHSLKHEGCDVCGSDCLQRKPSDGLAQQLCLTSDDNRRAFCLGHYRLVTAASLSGSNSQ